MSTEWTWHKVTKSFKGGRDEYQIRIPKGVRLSKDDWASVLEWIGENTDGGHAYGYSMNTKRLRNQSNTLRHIKFPSGLCESLREYGDVVVTEQKML